MSRRTRDQEVHLLADTDGQAAQQDDDGSFWSVDDDWVADKGPSPSQAGGDGSGDGDGTKTATCDPTGPRGHAKARIASGPGGPKTTKPPPSVAFAAPGEQDGVELDMDAINGRPGLHRSGKSGTPLLTKQEDKGETITHRGRRSSDGPTRSLDGSVSYSHDGFDGYENRTRPTATRRSTMRSRSPREVAAEKAMRRKYTFAAFFLAVSLVAFCVQTELSAYIQNDLGWSKAYCMMYFTHGSWVVLWPVTLAVVRVRKSKVPWSVFWRDHVHMIASTVTMIELQTLDVHAPATQRRARPWRYLVRTTALLTSTLTVAGLSWYIAVSLTTTSDLTAIYNCSAFFAYVFSVPILREPLRLDKSVSVFIAILGVLVVVYGDTEPAASVDAESGKPTPSGGSRLFGNLIIGAGSVLYGLHEVLYKRLACPPEGVSPGRGTVFANAFGACIGLFTLTVLWIPLPILHLLGIERFELPVASTCWLILAAVLANATFSGCFLVLISLTSPVLSSVAALLTIFIIALVDWVVKGQPLSWAAIIGGSMIIVAFLALSWSTYREMMEHEAQKMAVDLTDSDEEGDLSPSEH
ncbi:hypothetical protein RJ55_03617 [Drechmeria coniospora]|nr:hypothetical protein RJ55_03617 [Drechmeria coniospora]